jgi:hypothetical protein
MIDETRKSKLENRKPQRVERTPDFGVRGSYLTITGNYKEGRLPTSSGARVWRRTADLKGGGLRYPSLNFGVLLTSFEFRFSSFADT